jgi:cupin 2 domain-containing protein
LLEHPDFTLERIVSTGQSTPEGEWCDQDRDEWVILLAGSAGLSFEGEEEIKIMKPGDYVLIPAHTRHRVAWTDEKGQTVWLALHYRPQQKQ